MTVDENGNETYTEIFKCKDCGKMVMVAVAKQKASKCRHCSGDMELYED